MERSFGAVPMMSDELGNMFASNQNRQADITRSLYKHDIFVSVRT